MARIGIDLGGTKTELIILTNDGHIAVCHRAPTPSDYEDKLRVIERLVFQSEAEFGQIGLPVGVGHPGSHNRRTGLVRNANSTSLNGRALNADLEAVLKRPVRCANDANCFTLSEAIDGAGEQSAIVFGVIIGTGVGGGLVINKTLIEGHDGNAGEWGHTALPRLRPDEFPGPQSKCGRYGCVEAWCSGPAMSADHQRQTGHIMTVEQIAAAASAGDQACQDTLDRHVDRLGRALSTVVNTLDPDVIVLGGGLSNLPDIAKRTEQALYPHVFTDEPCTRVATNLHGDSSGVRGAAWLWPLKQ